MVLKSDQIDALVEGVMQSIRPMNGGLTLLAGNVWGLKVACQVFELVKKQMQGEGMAFTEIIRDRFDKACDDSLLIFAEFAFRDEPEHSAQLALQYLSQGKTVLALAHGVNQENVQRRLTSLGMDVDVVRSSKVVDYIVLDPD